MQLQSGLSERLGGSFAGPLSPRKLPTRLGNTPHRTNAVLAPSEVSREKRTTPKLGQSRGLAGALLSALRLWERQDQQKPKPEELVVEAAQRDPLSNDVSYNLSLVCSGQSVALFNALSTQVLKAQLITMLLCPSRM